MLGRNITLNAGNAGTILNLNGDFTGSGNNNIAGALVDDDQLAGNFTNVFSNSTTALARGTQLPLGPWKYLVLER